MRSLWLDPGSQVPKWSKTHNGLRGARLRITRWSKRSSGILIDPGEAEAIALALEVSADLLLMDERVGREAAEHLGLRPMGVIGLLIEAKRRKRVEAVKPLLDALRDRAGFRISGQLYARILADTGEEK